MGSLVTHLSPTPVNPPRAVVLGASGFVGQNLMMHLSESEIGTAALSTKDLDLCDPGSVEKLAKAVSQRDILVFVSALTPDMGRDISTFMRNLTMGENVCGFLEQNPPTQVIYVSSDAVYQDDTDLARETSPCNPSSYHGLMHLVRERMLENTLRASGTPLLILRPSLLFGTGDTHNGYGPNRFMRAAQNGEKITLFGEGEEKRDHVFISDLSRLIGLGMVHRSRGTMNVATGTAISFMDVARTVASVVNQDVPIETTPRQSPITHRHFDIAAIIKAFPSFKPVSLKVGLSQTHQAMSQVQAAGGTH